MGPPPRDKDVLPARNKTNRFKKQPSLTDVLSYSNPDVVGRYLKEYGGSRKEALLVFHETLKWLYLGHKVKNHKSHDRVECRITDDIEKIDDMWHTFILFTKDYSDFCRHFFGEYLHHQPTNDLDPLSQKEMKKQFRRFYEFVYDALGEETFHDWYFSGRFKKARKHRN